MLVQNKYSETKLNSIKDKSSEPIKEQGFIFTQFNEIGVLRVNSSRTNFINASNFKTFCDSIFRNNFKIIIDFRRCEILDAAFIGAIVLSLKNIKDENPKLKLVINDYVQINYCQRKPIGELFEVFDNLNDAIESYKVDLIGMTS